MQATSRSLLRIPLIAGAGGVCPPSLARWFPALFVVGSVLWTAVSTLRVYPHELAYFNEAAGGPEHGHQHLLGSNLDWGQDVLFLKQWILDHSAHRPLILAIVVPVNPKSWGIDNGFSVTMFGPNTVSRSNGAYYVVSASRLHHLLYNDQVVRMPKNRVGAVLCVFSPESSSQMIDYFRSQ